MTRTGIFGGTFNPVHRGHMALAHWLIDHNLFDEIWLTLSPANPLKNDRPGATDADRRAMLELACNGSERIKPCFIEFNMPRPSYTVNTLRHLAAEYPDRSFRLIIGADNWQIFNRWREPENIISGFGVVIYPRPACEINLPLPHGVEYLADAPVCNVSSSEIRNGLRRDLLLPEIASYIHSHNLYEQSETVK